MLSTATQPAWPSAATLRLPARTNLRHQPKKAFLASPAAREELLGFLSLNAHFTTADIADLRDLLAQYPAAAVYNAVQRACREHLQQQLTAADRAAQEQLNKMLLTPLFHFACTQRLSHATA
ncbi:hypothetical protein F0P96_10865 [Hymenobacter busanensis]|uniref:Uncharacterized protein n=1 Tax=Hymenobacter busanensis TaxID=2607656 RepID=A0A7L4ZYD3_9BACT|nr:hypothetical protein [Hymenobacter busanensis]KAA9333461.1 hypothetical protein F0P96_10865 [Hymenobacter busanensis]QHJ07856.1 hypothetical protein GUY19_11425 [Hymenobacter busanensis]